MPVPKPSPPWWRWAIWWPALLTGMFLFYVLLTPIWIGIRVLAWIAEFRARRRRQTSRAGGAVSDPGSTR